MNDRGQNLIIYNGTFGVIRNLGKSVCNTLLLVKNTEKKGFFVNPRKIGTVYLYLVNIVNYF